MALRRPWLFAAMPMVVALTANPMAAGDLLQPGAGLTRSVTARRSNNWQRPALPHARCSVEGSSHVFVSPCAPDRAKSGHYHNMPTHPNAKLSKHSQKTVVYGRELV